MSKSESWMALDATRRSLDFFNTGSGEYHVIFRGEVNVENYILDGHVKMPLVDEL